MYLILEHTSLAQYGMSHFAKGMVVPVIGSLVVAFSLLCMAKEFTSLLAFQCGDCFYCCCHSYIIFRIFNYNVDRYSEKRTALALCLLSYRFSGVYAARTVQAECNGTCSNSCVLSVASDTLRDVERLRRSPSSQPSRYKGTTFFSINDKIWRV